MPSNSDHVIFLGLGCNAFVAEALGDGISKKHLSTEFVRSGFIAKLDKAIYQGEQFFVTVATIVMIFAVFFGIVWNFFSTPKGKMYSIVQALTAEGANVALISGSITIALWLAACIFAVKTAKTNWTTSKHVVYGLAIGVSFLAFGKILVVMLPNGLIFAQRLALCLMLWVVMLGSSMAAYTRRHIVLQAIRKLIPDHMLRQHAALGLITAAVFTLFLAIVGWDYAVINFKQWVNADMKAGKFESIPIPYWAITIAIPVGFGLTLARFVGHAFFILKGVMEPVPTEEELKAARGEIGADADYDEFSRIVDEEEVEKNELESLAWKTATGVDKPGDNAG